MIQTRQSNKQMGEVALEWQVFRRCNNSGVAAADAQAVSSDTSNTGSEPAAHISICVLEAAEINAL